MAKLGHEVVGVDVLDGQVAALARGEAPFYEPGLPELLTEASATGRLRFTTDKSEAAGAEVHFICVGTPQRRGENAADLSYVYGALDDLMPHLKPGDVVVGKSTVPVGTAERLAERIRDTVPEATLLWNPEFLREGHAVDDTLRPDRFVYGVTLTENSGFHSSVASGTASRIRSAICSAVPTGTVDLPTTTSPGFRYGVRSSSAP